MDRDTLKRGLVRLIAEAPQLAPGIWRFDGKSYGHVTDEGLDAQRVQRWTLEAIGILQELASEKAPGFLRLFRDFHKLEDEAKEFHSRAIFVHKATQLLQTAKDLLASTVEIAVPVVMGGHQAEQPHMIKPTVAVAMAVPEKITLAWLANHVPVSFWVAALSMLGLAFVAGLQASRLRLAQEIFGLASSICGGN